MPSCPRLDEPGHQKFARAVDDTRAEPDVDVRDRTDGGNAIAAHQHGRGRLRGCAGSRDDCRVTDREQTGHRLGGAWRRPHQRQRHRAERLRLQSPHAVLRATNRIASAGDPA
jgi:hypothetical protein